uniref:DUF3444 domain-containing protein n=1 Tax=Rhabditophanes sp. KR3021 TaxID=114890 RepID=A0AC35TFX6_9BILA
MEAVQAKHIAELSKRFAKIVEQCLNGNSIGTELIYLQTNQAIGAYFENNEESSEIEETTESRPKFGKKSNLSSDFQCIHYSIKSKDEKGCYVYLMTDPRVVHNNWTKSGVKEDSIKSKDEKGCYVYLMTDPRVVHNNWTKSGVKEGIRCIGRTGDFDGRMTSHKTKSNHVVDLKCSSTERKLHQISCLW